MTTDTKRYALRIYAHFGGRMVALTRHPTREEAEEALAAYVEIHGISPYRIDDEMAPDLPSHVDARPHGPWDRRSWD